MIDLDSFILSLQAAWMNRFSCNRDWAQVVLAYCKSNTTEPIESKQCLFNQIIWGNRYFKYIDECLYSKNMIDASIIFIKDVSNFNGSIKATIYTKIINKNTSKT